MKKVVFTLYFAALCAVFGNAQTYPAWSSTSNYASQATVSVPITTTTNGTTTTTTYDFVCETAQTNEPYNADPSVGTNGYAWSVANTATPLPLLPTYRYAVVGTVATYNGSTYYLTNTGDSYPSQLQTNGTPRTDSWSVILSGWSQWNSGVTYEANTSKVWQIVNGTIYYFVCLNANTNRDPAISPSTNWTVSDVVVLPYVSTLHYAILGMSVTYNGNTYSLLSEALAGQSPSSNPNLWQQWVNNTTPPASCFSSISCTSVAGTDGSSYSKSYQSGTAQTIVGSTLNYYDASHLTPVITTSMASLGEIRKPVSPLALNDNDILFRGADDIYHGIGYYGSSGNLDATTPKKRNFADTPIDGPVLFGWAGGALGLRQRVDPSNSSSNTTEKLALRWDWANVYVGSTALPMNFTVNGTLTGSTGLTVTGGAVSLNNNSNFATNINTGTSTGNVTIGNTTGTITFPKLSTGIVHSTGGLLSSSAVGLASTDVSGVLPIANGGTNSSTALNNNRIMVSSNNAITELAAGGAGQVLTTNAGGVPSWAAPSIGLSANVSGVLPIANGGTNSSTALNNNRIMVSSNNAITELAAGGAGQVLTINGTGTPSWTSPSSVIIGTNMYTCTNAPNSTGGYNTFIGYAVGYSNTTGNNNVFTGFFAGLSNTKGSENTFTGCESGDENTTGSNNVFTGYASGTSNTSGSENTFTGYMSGISNTTGSNNVFTGYGSGINDTTGSENVFTGYLSGTANTTGSNNTFYGALTGILNRSDSNSTYIGYSAGYSNTGDNNVFLGSMAGSNETSLNNKYILSTPANATYLMYGDFKYNQIAIGTNKFAGTNTLTVAGGANISGNTTIGSGTFQIDAPSNPGGRFYIDQNGTVGIGLNNPSGTTLNSNYKLQVAGTIVATEVKVAYYDNGWPDYVFKKGYKLQPLSEVEQYVTANSHLPEVPSSAEVGKDGINVGDMNATLLKKVEELTLYLIEQNKRMIDQNNRISELEKQNAELMKTNPSTGSGTKTKN